MYRPTFVTNSSSSCMIIWEKNPMHYPDDANLYQGDFVCPHCHERIGLGRNDDLNQYMDEKAEALVMRKMAEGCTIFYKIAYLGQFAEDEIEHGTEDSGWYSFQC